MSNLVVVDTFISKLFGVFFFLFLQGGLPPSLDHICFCFSFFFLLYSCRILLLLCTGHLKPLDPPPLPPHHTLLRHEWGISSYMQVKANEVPGPWEKSEW